MFIDANEESNEQLLQSAEETTSSATDNSFDDDGLVTGVKKKYTGMQNQ